MTSFMKGLAAALSNVPAFDQVFMIVKAFLDESGTHSDSSHTVVAGWVSPLGRWLQFEAAWDRLLKRNGVDYAHAIEVIQGKKEFKGWGFRKREKFVDETTKIINKHALFGVSAVINNKDYDDHYVAANRPRQVQLDTKYGLCFRLLLLNMPATLLEHFKRPDLDLHIVMESGAKNAGDVVRLLDVFKKHADPDHVAMV